MHMGSSHLDLYQHLSVVEEILLVEVLHVDFVAEIEKVDDNPNTNEDVKCEFPGFH